jgi:hypothetical protein
VGWRGARCSHSTRSRDHTHARHSTERVVVVPPSLPPSLPRRPTVNCPRTRRMSCAVIGSCPTPSAINSRANQRPPHTPPTDPAPLRARPRPSVCPSGRQVGQVGRVSVCICILTSFIMRPNKTYESAMYDTGRAQSIYLARVRRPLPPELCCPHPGPVRAPAASDRRISIGRRPSVRTGEPWLCHGDN